MSDKPTFLGQPIDQGQLVPRPLVEGEGYATLRCGNTEVLLSYTLLHHLRFDLSGRVDSLAGVEKANDALAAITAEASIGRTPRNE